MQSEQEKYDTLLTTVDQNFNKMIEKLYTRENAATASEVKETYFSPNSKSFFTSFLYIPSVTPDSSPL